MVLLSTKSVRYRMFPDSVDFPASTTFIRGSMVALDFSKIKVKVAVSVKIKDCI